MNASKLSTESSLELAVKENADNADRSVKRSLLVVEATYLSVLVRFLTLLCGKCVVSSVGLTGERIIVVYDLEGSVLWTEYTGIDVLNWEGENLCLPRVLATYHSVLAALLFSSSNSGNGSLE